MTNTPDSFTSDVRAEKRKYIALVKNSKQQPVLVHKLVWDANPEDAARVDRAPEDLTAILPQDGISWYCYTVKPYSVADT